jgi:hypothetical protein
MTEKPFTHLGLDPFKKGNGFVGGKTDQPGEHQIQIMHPAINVRLV